MYFHSRQNIEFVSQFIDSITVRPFLEDLRRVKRATEQFPLVSKSPPKPSTQAA
jgi:hypothetical protein